MFLAQQTTIAEVNDYDFEKVENAAKWKGLFINSLRKVSYKYVVIVRTTIGQPIGSYDVIWKLYIFFLIFRFLSRFIHHYLLEKMHYSTSKVYVFDYCQCCAQNRHRIQYR